jgi:steroid delta-isomerase
MIPDRVRDHASAFNAAVRSGDFDPFLDTFADAAVMRFIGLPTGPFVGRTEIARAYEQQPPTDTLTVDGVATDGDVDVVRVRWDRGGVGTFTVRWEAGLVADLTVAFG